MALPARLPFVLPFGWTMRVNISKGTDLSPSGSSQATRRELSSAGKALASLPPSLHCRNEADSVVLCWHMSHK